MVMSESCLAGQAPLCRFEPPEASSTSLNTTAAVIPHYRTLPDRKSTRLNSTPPTKSYCALCFFKRSGDHQDLPSSPTRRSSDICRFEPPEASSTSLNTTAAVIPHYRTL